MRHLFGRYGEQRRLVCTASTGVAGRALVAATAHSQGESSKQRDGVRVTEAQYAFFLNAAALGLIAALHRRSVRGFTYIEISPPLVRANIVQILGHGSVLLPTASLSCSTAIR